VGCARVDVRQPVRRVGHGRGAVAAWRGARLAPAFPRSDRDGAAHLRAAPRPNPDRPAERRTVVDARRSPRGDRGGHSFASRRADARSTRGGFLSRAGAQPRSVGDRHQRRASDEDRSLERGRQQAAMGRCVAWSDAARPRSGSVAGEHRGDHSYAAVVGRRTAMARYALPAAVAARAAFNLERRGHPYCGIARARCAAGIRAATSADPDRSSRRRRSARRRTASRAAGSASGR